jgi:predicted nucleic acid-binding protein
MRIVIDTNILISAIIRDSLTRNLLFENSSILFIPEYALEEIGEHMEELIEKSDLDENEISSLIENLIKRLKIIKKVDALQFRERALEVMRSIDLDDVLIVASALFVEGSIIWSEDKALKKQNEVRVCNTSEIISLLNDASESNDFDMVKR